MDIAELWALLQWFNKHLGPKFPRRYAALHAALTNNIQPNNQKQPVGEPAKQLTDLLRNVPVDVLTTSQLKFLADIEVASYVGETGAQKIEALLAQSAIDPVAAVNGVQEMINAATRAVERIGKLSSGLEGMVPAISPEDDYAIVRVTFAHAAALNNVVDFKEWGNTWYLIARGITMAYGQAPESVRVVGASRGSIVIDLAVIYAIAKVFGSIVRQALEATNTLQEIRLKEQQIRELKLNNDILDAGLNKARQQLLATAAEAKDAVIQTIAEEAIADAGINARGEGDKCNALRNSVRLLVEFLNDGGNLDIVVKRPEAKSDGQADDGGNLRVEVERQAEVIRQLTRQVKFVEHKPANDDKHIDA
jgi:hypothetical protein